VGEISDALRRARGGASKDSAGRGKKERIASPEEPARRPEPRPRILQPDRGRARPAVQESDDSRRVSLGRDREEGWQSRIVAIDGNHPATESFRQLALRVRAELERRSLRSVVVTGPLRGEGKTTVACGLALALASVSRGREVALVDLDLRKPSVATDLRIRVDTGIEEVILGARALSEVRVSIEKPAADVFPAARPDDSAHELLIQPGFTSLIRELERRYATVICDTPPVLPVPDTGLILDQVGVYIAVARAGATRERALQSMVGLLPRDRLLGTVFNEGQLPVAAKHYGYYGGDSGTSRPGE
jgi:Mrp family chromosome partitioning ATPase